MGTRDRVFTRRIPDFAGPLVHQPVAVSREQRRTLVAEFM